GYYTEKKAYIRIRTWNIFDWYNALKARQKNWQVPNAKYDKDKVFMICMTVHWKNDPELLKQICFVNVEIALDLRLITIVCFNDSQYDWQFIVKKANKLGILEWMFNHMSFKPLSLEKIIKWEYRYNMIK
ncbi:18294_t:CDS:2, partial [Funneliformis geosporum]